MKKKGLIIATIVMVLVLAVSLTTATYAWFTTTASSSIQNITVSVAGGTDVLIGISNTGSKIASPTSDDFFSGTCSYAGTGPSTGTWSGTQGLGANVETGLTLATIQKAVSTSSQAAATASSTTVDAANAQMTGANFVKAAGSGTAITSGTFEDAVQNSATINSEAVGGDYLHFTLGMLANKTTVDTVTLNITVAPTDNKTSMGMTAGMHIIYKLDSAASWTNIDVGGANSYATLKTAVNQADTNGSNANNPTGQALAAGWQNFQITFGTATQSLGTNPATDIHQIELYIYYVGTDTDCVNAALGSAATVYFTVKNTNGATA